MTTSSLLKTLLSSSLFLALFAVSGYAQGNYVYINNNTDANTVSAYAVNASGALTPVAGSPYATGGAGNSAASFRTMMRAETSIVGNFLYVTNEAGNSISAFAINPANGKLTIVPGAPFATGGIDEFGLAVAATPDNKFLIAANSGSQSNDGSISVFAIAANGALTPVAGSSVAAQFHPSSLKISPDGKFVYLTEPYNDQIAAYSIAANGALTPVPGSPFANGGITLEMNCAGTLLFSPVLNFQTTKVNVFNVAADGSLSLIQGSPFLFPGGADNEGAVLSPDSHFLFISNQTSNTLTVLSVAADGSLSAIPGSPFSNTGGHGPQQVTVNQTGSLLYAVNDNATFSVFNIAANGTLMAVAGSPFTVASGAQPGVAAYPPKSCGVAPPDFDICLRDDTTGNIFKFNSQTGAYFFTGCGRKAVTGGGTGKVSSTSCVTKLKDGSGSVHASYDSCAHSGSATIVIGAKTYTVTDRNTLKNHTCSCPQ